MASGRLRTTSRGERAAEGVTTLAADVLIAACARRHGAALEYADADFDLLATVDAPAQ